MVDGHASAKGPSRKHDDAHTHAPSPPLGPIIAAPGESAATASRPDQPLDSERYHIYESNPAPWWIGLLWIAFLVFGAAYLIVNLLE